MLKMKSTQLGLERGDLVRRTNISNGNNGAEIGQLAVVNCIEEDEEFVYVIYKGQAGAGRGAIEGEGWYPMNLEKVV